MRRLAAVLLLAAAAACGVSPCQTLGERICGCQPGYSTDTCKTLVERQLKDSKPSDAQCQAWLDSCQPPAGSDLCEYMLTAAGQQACGLAPPP
jgi:hypothetical protein